MKKLKKILLSLCLCVSLVGVGLSATACSSSDFTKEQREKLLEIVDHSEEFMNNTLDILENQVNKIEKEEAFLKVKEAEAKLLSNYNGTLDNLKIEYSSDNVSAKTDYYFYKSGHNNFCIISLPNRGEFSVYAKGDQFSALEGKAYHNKNGVGSTTNSEIDVDTMKYISAETAVSTYFIPTSVDDIYSCETTEDGNLLVTAKIESTKVVGLGENDVWYAYVTLLISKDSKILSADANVACRSYENAEDITPTNVSFVKFSAKLTYGTLTDASVKTFVDYCKSYI